MKKIRIYIIAATMLGGVLIYSSCEKDQGPIVVLPKGAPLVSFNDTIQPILTANCAVSGCHVTGHKTPDLSAGNAYTSLTTGGYINTTTPTSSTVYEYLTGVETPQMPLGKSPNPDGIEGLMLTWIQQGALNN